MEKIYYVNNKIMDKIFKGEIIKNRIWNNETIGQSYNINDCIELNNKLYKDFLNNIIKDNENDKEDRTNANNFINNYQL